jgi:hypothetical protein
MRKFIPLLFISFLLSAVTEAAPIRVLDLRVVSANATSVTVNWTTPAPGSGSLLENDVRVSAVPITALNWATRTQIAGEPIPTTPGTTQSAIVSGLSPGTTYFLALKVRDSAGWSLVSNVVTTTLVAGKSARVIWTAPRDVGLLGYYACQSKDQANWSCHDAGNVTAVEFEGLTFGSPDYFRANAYYRCTEWPTNPCEGGRVYSGWSNTAVKP